MKQISTGRAVLYLSLAALACGGARADFALKDGDTLAFLGDSITAARGYTKIVEHYTLMRFPDRHVRFVNAGEGGDTASKCLARLDRDVFAQGATVVTVAFGINDIAWGTKADDEHKQAYLDGIRTIIERCREHKVRPVICSPAITDVPPDEAEKGYLQSMTDEGLTLAKSLGAETIDIQRSMREIQRRVVQSNATKTNADDRVKLHVKDGVHLAELGQLTMAYAILKGLGAPEEVSSAVVDAKTGKATAAAGCEISEVEADASGVSFTRLDRGLPLNLGPLSPLNYQWVPLPDGINQYLLKVEGLPDGDYTLTAEGRALGKQSAADLAKGVNLSSATADGWQPGGPWDAQSCVVKELVDARDKLEGGRALQSRLLPNRPGFENLTKDDRKLESELVSEQRQVAKPYPYHFEIRKAVAK
jgi:lysophospholipase L1-like esterase